MEALMTNLDNCDTNGNCDAKEACDSSTDFMGYLPINDPMLLMDPWNTDNINNSMNTNVDSLSTCSSSVGSDGNTGNNSSSPPSPDSPSHLSDCLHNTSDSCNVTARSNRRNIHGKKLYTAELDVMCRICGDKASGLHYGVHSCEGCKGFFRRTLKKNLIYKACNLGKNCKVNSGSRNKCQYCRFQRCLTAGMSQTAVRYGRMPKKEREKLVVDKEELQNNTTERLLELRCLSDTIIASFKHIFPDSTILPTEKEQEDVLQSHLTEIKNSHYFHAENVFHLFQSIIVPIMQAAVAFAKKIPGFCTFSMNDQIILMKQGTLAVAVLLFYKHVGQTFVKLKGHGLEMYLSRKSIIDTYECQQLLQIPVIIADKIHRLQLTNTELALYVAVVLLADGCNIENSAQVDSIRTDILHAFQLELKHNHPKCGTIALGRVLMLMSDLRQFVEEFAVCCNQRLFDTTDNFSNTAPLLREIFCT